MPKKKDRSFAAKAAKALAREAADQCPECGSTIEAVYLVTPMRSPRTHAWRFRGRNVKVCSCNRQDLGL